MPDDMLLTLKQLANELALPESTVRYYRDAFLDHIPSVGTGRRRRYPPQAIAVLRSIARLYAAGKAKAEITRAIEQSPRNGAVAASAAKAPAARTVEEVSNLDLLAALLDGEREQRDALWQMAKEIVRLTDVLSGQDAVLNEIADRAGVIVSPPPRPALTQPAVATARLSAPAAVAAAAPVAAPAPIAAQVAVPPPAAPAPVTGTEAAAVEPPAPLQEAFVPAGEAAPFASSMFNLDAVASSPPEPPAAPERVSWNSAPVASDAAAAPVHPAPVARTSPASGHDDIDKLRAELEAERALVDRLRESKLQLEHRVSDAEAAMEDRLRQRRPSVLKRLLGSDSEA